MSDSTTGEHPATQAELKTAINWGSAKTVGTLVVAIFAGGWVSYATVTHAAEQTVDGGLAPMRAELSDLEKRLDRHINDEAEHHKRQEEEARAIRDDLREFYRSNRTGVRSERLETPLPPVDAGAKP